MTREKADIKKSEEKSSSLYRGDTKKLYSRVPIPNFLLLLQKKVAKKSRADFDAALSLFQPSRGQNRRSELNFLDHFASNNKQDGMNSSGCTPNAEWVFKMNYYRVLCGRFQMPQ